MAVEAGTIYQDIRIRLDKMNGDVINVESNFGKIGKAAKETKKSFDILGAAGQAFSFAFGFGIADIAKKVRDWAVDVFFSFERANDIIGKSTGAIGQDLTDLNNVFEDVLANGIEQGSDEVAAAVGELNVRLGVTGDNLRALTLQVGAFADVTNMNMKDSVVGVTKVMSRWNIETYDMGITLDKVAKAAQLSGISAGSLMDTLSTSAAQLKAVNFSFDESVALIAAMEKAGVRTENVMSGFNKAVSSMASSGKDAKTEIKNLFNAIQNAEDPTKATALAVEVFGFRAGPELTDALRSGKLDIDAWTSSIAEAGGTVAATDAATANSKDTMAIYANKTKAAVGGLFKQIGKDATDSFTGILAFAGGVGELGVKLFDKLSKGYFSNQEKMQQYLVKMQSWVAQQTSDNINTQMQILQNAIGNLKAAGDWTGANQAQAKLTSLYAQQKLAEDAAAKAKADADAFVADYKFTGDTGTDDAAAKAQDTANKKKAIEDEYARKLITDKIEALKAEQQAEIDSANEVGASTADIEKYYAGLIADEEERARDEKKEKDIQNAKDIMSEISTYANLASGAISGVLGELSRQELEAIDARYQAELEANGLGEKSAIEKAQAEIDAATAAGDADALIAAQTAMKKAQIDTKYQKEKATAQYNAAMAEWNNKWIMSLVDGASAVIEALPNVALSIATGIAAGLNTGVILANKPKAPSFTTGGIVPGNFTSGDKISAQLNSGEMVLNTAQQTQLFDMINSGGQTKSFAGTYSAVIHLDKYTFKDATIEIIQNAARDNQIVINKGALN